MVKYFKALDSNKTEAYDVLLSIKPVFIKKIISGQKKYEFRKSIFRRSVNRIYLYASSPVQRVMGYFPYKGHIAGGIEEVWSVCKQEGGITKEFFFNYFSKRKIAFAIIIDHMVLFRNPLNLSRVGKDIKPPQSFLYLRGKYDEHSWDLVRAENRGRPNSKRGQTAY